VKDRERVLKAKDYANRQRQINSRGKGRQSVMSNSS